MGHRADAMSLYRSNLSKWGEKTPKRYETDGLILTFSWFSTSNTNSSNIPSGYLTVRYGIDGP